MGLHTEWHLENRVSSWRSKGEDTHLPPVHHAAVVDVVDADGCLGAVRLGGHEICRARRGRAGRCGTLDRRGAGVVAPTLSASAFTNPPNADSRGPWHVLLCRGFVGRDSLSPAVAAVVDAVNADDEAPLFLALLVYGPAAVVRARGLGLLRPSARLAGRYLEVRGRRSTIVVAPGKRG